MSQVTQIRRMHRWTESDIQELRVCFRQGMSAKQAATAMRITLEAVRRACSTHGVSVRREQHIGKLQLEQFQAG